MYVSAHRRNQGLTTVGAANAADVDRRCRCAARNFDEGAGHALRLPRARRSAPESADRNRREALALTVMGVARQRDRDSDWPLKGRGSIAGSTFSLLRRALDKVLREIANPPSAGLCWAWCITVLWDVVAIVPWNFPLMIGA